MLEPDVGQHHDRRAEHVGGVVAAAEARLDHGDLDAALGELGERRGGQQLELRDALAARERAVDLGGRRGARARPPRRSASGSRSASPMRMRSAKVARCGER